jgi:thymidylate synthase (FAD)
MKLVQDVEKNMQVKLVAVTSPKIEGLNSAEDIVSYCARVSNPSNQMNTETAPRLLKYLIKHQHWSPFEMASATIEIVTSRAIAAQILRHRSFSFQEFSQRYSIATKLEDIQWRMQGKTNRQVGDAEVDLPPEKLELVNNALDSSLKAYDALIECGVAKECARLVLPLTTQTTMYMTGTLRSWIHYIDLRAKEDTQKEHREIAIAIKNIFVQEFPVISEALGWK